MKKISLKNLDTHKIDILSKEQMKAVIGGVMGSQVDETADCIYDTGCTSRCSRGGYCSTCCNA